MFIHVQVQHILWYIHTCRHVSVHFPFLPWYSMITTKHKSLDTETYQHWFNTTFIIHIFDKSSPKYNRTKLAVHIERNLQIFPLNDVTRTSHFLKLYVQNIFKIHCICTYSYDHTHNSSEKHNGNSNTCRATIHFAIHWFICISYL